MIESNAATIRILEGVQKKMSRMAPEELTKFRLDDTLGGSSPTIHIRAIKRYFNYYKCQKILLMLSEGVNEVD